MSRIRVLLTSRLGVGDPTYVDHVANALPSDVIPMPFSYRTALVGRWDVLHVHWPETILRHADPRRRALRRLLFVMLLLRIASTRAPVVRTVHNLHPHEPGPWLESWLLRRLDGRVNTWVRLNPVTEPPGRGALVTIPHGHYSKELRTEDSPTTDVMPDPGHLLFFGFVRPYKGVEELIAVVSGMEDTDVHLTVAGKPSTETIRRTVETASRGDDRIELRLEFVPDAELGALIAACSVVVLPYRDMHNSGAIFASLSAGRPLLVQRNAVTAALQEEFGRAWVSTFDAPLDADDLRSALRKARGRDRAATPDLSGRSWPEVARRYAEVYRRLTDSPR